MAKLTSRRTDDPNEWDALLDNVKIGIVYRPRPGEYRPQYTFVERSKGERMFLFGWEREPEFARLSEALQWLEEQHSPEIAQMERVAKARRAERERQQQ